MGHPSRSMEDSGAEKNLNWGNLSEKVSGEKNASVRPRDCSCDIILAKNGAAFCPCLKSLKWRILD